MGLPSSARTFDTPGSDGIPVFQAKRDFRQSPKRFELLFGGSHLETLKSQPG
jgi:hypothetical protein